jgi:hypothetical protein
VSANSSNPTLVSNENIVLAGNGADRTITLTPEPNQSGTSTISVTVSDGTSTATDTFVLTVNPVNDAPTIGDIGERSTAEDTPTAVLHFTVGDPETPASSLIVTGSSSNPTLMPDKNIVLGGSGVNRTVTVTPAHNQSGTATITLTVSDGTTPATSSFTLTVTPVNDPPTVSDIADQTAWLGNPVPQVTFSVGDIETPDGLIVSATSSNHLLIPDAGLILGGSGSHRTLTMVRLGAVAGRAAITVTVSDGELNAGDTFVLNVEIAEPVVHIHSPNGGEKLFKQWTYDISWTAAAGAAPVASFDVFYSSDNGASFALVTGCSNLGAEVRECKWKPGKSSAAGLVRVVATDRANRTGIDQSDVPFSVVPGSPLVSITSPNSEVSWPIGHVRTIAWRHNLGSDTHVETFTVEVSRHSKYGPWETIARVPQLSATKGQLAWTVTGPPVKRAKIRVRSSTVVVEAMSERSFSIVQPR